MCGGLHSGGPTVSWPLAHKPHPNRVWCMDHGQRYTLLHALNTTRFLHCVVRSHLRSEERGGEGWVAGG